MNLNILISSKQHTRTHRFLPKEINTHFMRTKRQTSFIIAIGNRNCKLRAPFDHSIFRWHQASNIEHFDGIVPYCERQTTKYLKIDRVESIELLCRICAI